MFIFMIIFMILLFQKPTHKAYTQCLRLLVWGITLEHTLADATSKAKKTYATNIADHISRLQQGYHYWCDKLLMIFFPLHCNPWWSSYESMRDLVQEINQEPVVQALKEYTSTIFTETKEWDRSASSDLHMDMYNFLALSKCGISTLETFLSKEEIKFNERRRKRQLPVQCHRGFRIGRGIGRMSANYFRRYLEGAKAFAAGDAMKAVVHTNHFILHMSMNQQHPMLPSLAHVMQLIELNYVVIQGLYMCHERNPNIVILPQSYVSTIYHHDMIHEKSGRSYIQRSISQSRRQYRAKAPDGKDLSGHMGFLAAHMCGNSRVNFNMIRDAFAGNPKCIQSGEAERVLIMLLVMLCNTGGTHFIKAGYERRLQIALAKISMSSHDERKYPPRLVEAVMEAKNATSRQMFGKILETLLHNRHGEKLLCCYWNRHRHVIGCSDFSAKYIEDQHFKPVQQLALMRSSDVASYQTYETDEDIQEDDEVDDTELYATAEQDEKRQKAANSIQKAFRAYMFKIALQKRKTTTSEDEKYVDVKIDDYIDNTMCQLCNVKFERHQDKLMTTEMPDVSA